MTDTVTPSPLARSLSILVHGASKAGKSAFSVTSPSPRCYCDVESASRFLAIKPIKWDPATEAPPVYDGTWDTAVVETRDWATVEQVYRWFESGEHPFNSLVIDSISELQQRYIESKAGRSQLTQQGWGDAFRVVSGLIRDIRDLTMHPTKPLECVVMTAMTRQIDGLWKPWLQGQLQTVIPYLVDVCAYLWADQEEDGLSGDLTEVRTLLTRRTREFEADGRIPAMLRLKSRKSGEAGNDIVGIMNMIFGPRPKPARRTVRAEDSSAESATAPTTADTPTPDTPTPTEENT
jgi:hypothetical protein